MDGRRRVSNGQTEMEVEKALNEILPSHCHNDCEHPQPFKSDDGREWCGKCWCKYHVAVEMIPCTPETCKND